MKKIGHKALEKPTSTSDESNMKENHAADCVFQYEIFYWDQACWRNKPQTKDSQVKKDQLKPVWKALIGKYDLMFNKFRKNQIEMILHNISDALITLAYKDTTILANKNQYMRKYYSNTHDQHESEISGKMKLIINYYGKRKDRKFTYEHPTAFVAGMQQIFANRIRCLNKNKAIDLSSEVSTKKQKRKRNIKNYSWVSRDFLVLSSDTSLVSHSDSLFQEFMVRNNDELSFETSSYNIYREQSDIKTLQNYQEKGDEEIIIDIRVIPAKQKTSQHQDLIIDFTNEAQAEKPFFEMIENEGFKGLQKLVQKGVLKIETIEKIKQEILKDFDLQSRSRDSDQHFGRNQARIVEIRHQLRNRRNRETPTVQSLRKGSARKKAEQLLKRIEQRRREKEEEYTFQNS